MGLLEKKDLTVYHHNPTNKSSNILSHNVGSEFNKPGNYQLVVTFYLLTSTRKYCVVF